MPRLIANVKVFAAATVLFAVASVYNLANSTPVTPRTSVTAVAPASEVVGEAPAVASSQPTPRS
jgi:hypothetical protein